MWQKLNQQQRNFMYIAAAVLVCYLAYQLSFRNTIMAISLYHQLGIEQRSVEAVDGSFAQVRDKDNFYSKVVGAYYMRSDDLAGRLWESVSGVSVAKGVGIGFNPNSQLIADSLETKNKLFRQEYSFKGNYANLVNLVDSISKTQGIGKISALRIFVPKEVKVEGELQLKLSLAGIQR